jgi:SSS family solute:Na+ symporter
LLGVDFWTGAILIVLFTGLYTVIGGLKVVVYTDLIQMIVLLGGSIALTYYGMQELGSWEVVKERTSPEYLSLWRDLKDPAFPWTGILFGAPILGVWYWCTDQFIVQRVISAKNIDNARKGTIFGAFLKLLPLFLFVVPGVIAYALSVGDNPVITFPVNENGAVDYDAALPLLTMGILPAGLKGLVAAGLLAALMSSLSSVFNSCSTLFTMDVYRKYYPETSQKKLVKVGQIATVILVVLGIAWIPMMELIKGGIFQKLQSIQAYISPPIAAVFLIGIFSRKITAKAAKASLLIGGLIGALRLILEIVQEKIVELGSSLPDFVVYFTEINFLHFAVLLFAICVAILILFSKIKDEKPLEEIKDITYERGVSVTEKSTINIWLSVIVVICVIALWVIFR